MSKINRFKAALSKMLAALGSVSTDRGVLSWDGDEDLKEGDAVFIEDAEGNRSEPEDGSYITSDAKTIEVEGGVVVAIRDPEAEVAPEPDVEMGRVATDKGELLWEGEDDLAAGMEVYVEDAEGNRTPAEDGEYTIEDGKVIVVVESKVAEIRDPEAEVASDPETEELRKEVAKLRAQVKVLTKKVTALSRIPTAKSAHEEVKSSAQAGKTGVKAIDRLDRYINAMK